MVEEFRKGSILVRIWKVIVVFLYWNNWSYYLMGESLEVFSKSQEYCVPVWTERIEYEVTRMVEIYDEL